MIRKVLPTHHAAWAVWRHAAPLVAHHWLCGVDTPATSVCLLQPDRPLHPDREHPGRPYNSAPAEQSESVAVSASYIKPVSRRFPDGAVGPPVGLRGRATRSFEAAGEAVKLGDPSMVTVLILHRSRIQRVALGNALREGLQWNVVFAGEPAEAEEYLRHVPVDLILAEPVETAGDRHVFERLRSGWPEVPMVAVVPGADDRAALDALVDGAIAVVSENAGAEEISRTLEQILASFKQYARVPGLLECMRYSETEFVIRNDRRLLKALVERLVAGVHLFGVCPSSDLPRVALALQEALINAAHHGCMELDSRLRQLDAGAYFELAARRERAPEYANRRIRVREVLSREEARFVIRDEGAGFDVGATMRHLAETGGEPRAYGRGLALIRALMDEVHFNEQGNEITLVLRAKRADRDEWLLECWDEGVLEDEADDHLWEALESRWRRRGACSGRKPRARTSGRFTRSGWKWPRPDTARRRSGCLPSRDAA